MKKYFLAIIVIFAAVVAALNILPSDAKSPAGDTAVKNTVGQVLVKQIPVPVVSAPIASSTVNDKAPVAPKKVIPAKPKVAAAVSTPASKTNSKVTIASSGVKWAPSGLSAIGSLASFDYSTSIRNSYKRKVEAYAKSKGITLITASVVNSMHQ
jgi:hypothetical protein